MHFSCVFAKKALPLYTFLKKMENNQNIQAQPKPYNHAMRFGLEMGIFFGLHFILTAQSANSAWMGILWWLLTIYIIYGIFRSAIHYRMTECGGDITFGQSFNYIMWLFVFASIVATMVRVIYLKWFDSSVLTTLSEQTENMIKYLKYSEAEQELAKQSLRRMMQPVHFSMYLIMYDLFLGVITALMLSPLVKKKIRIDNQQ